MGLLGKKMAHLHDAASPSSRSTTPENNIARANDVEKTGGQEDTGKVPFLTMRTFIMAILAAMGGFVFGYDTGQISGFLEMPVFLERFGERKADGTSAFTNVRSGLIVGMLSIGTLIGCLVAAPLANKFGRKTCMPLWCIIFCIGVTVQIAVGPGMWVGIVMGRWVAGLGIGGMSVLTPLYVSESAPKHIRGAAVCCYQLFITVGIFTADAINFGTEKMTNTGSYRIPMGIGYLWALVLGLGILMMPESPRWDIKEGKNDRAFTAMTKFYGVSRNHRAVNREIKEINKALDAAKGDHPWYEAITGPRMLYRVSLGIALQCLQQLSGANFFFYFGTQTFSGIGISNSYVTAMILGGVNVGSTFLGLYLVEHFGRRKCLYFGALWMSVCFIVFASIGHFKFQPAAMGSAEAKSSGMIMIVFSCLFILAFASTWGPMVWAVIGEMFPYRYRAVSMAMATASNWFWNFMLAFFTPFITAAIDFRYGYVFAACNLVAAVLVYFCLMESAGRTLEEVDFMYITHVNPIKSSKWNPEEAGDLTHTDQLFLAKGGRDIQKRAEAGRGSVNQDEGVIMPEGGSNNVSQMPTGARVEMSPGDLRT